MLLKKEMQNCSGFIKLQFCWRSNKESEVVVRRGRPIYLQAMPNKKSISNWKTKCKKKNR